ncbi:hypothetical protein CH333_02115 [candidate division WOR-3 bacterium JGI_Cruoil_03_44_89]|uniref:Peptidase M14 domain-containing protein n=1 Tax=candidate division WOR-3 bacterium JGI_Cruoil_03_44_89 TaxID=1973748 RepID=A0A235BXF3_UNCW3|nr:MAG: hypothetical protein CH333_02115 [candidate division WOR-3 bacterium JGI_Cruoil_03_44_89]
MRYFSIISIFLFASALAGPFDPRYHTYDEELAELDSLCGEYGDIMVLDTLGWSSIDSIPIVGVKISDNPDVFEDEPKVLYNGLHHAEEFVSTEFCMYLINDLLAGYGHNAEITRWTDSVEIWVIPMLNPEGHGVAITGVDTIWRKNKRDNNENGAFDTDFDGVDLNRNYDFKWDIGGSTDPPSEYYRGPNPFSENETRIIRDLTLQNRFMFDICYHCARTGLTEMVYYPWRWHGQFSPDDDVIQVIADSVAKSIPNFAGTGTYTALYGNLSQGGSARNWFYGAVGTIAFTIELSERCYPPGEFVDSICENNLGGPYYLLEKAISGPGLTGHIYDSLSLAPLEAEIEVFEATDSVIRPRMSEPMYGRFYRLRTPGVYTVRVSADGYRTKLLEDVVVESDGFTHMDVFLTRDGGIDEEHIEDFVCPRVIPNPFLNETRIEAGGNTTVRIYDICGNVVKTLVLSGDAAMLWNGTDDGNRCLPSGIYFCVGRSGKDTFCKKMVKLAD